ncbi:MAG: hypothetical protein QXZ70_03605 [Candidatus Bathyarchaeia archaeon]
MIRLVRERGFGFGFGFGGLKFYESNKFFSCLFPDDSLQVAVKDTLLLNEYGMLKDFSVNGLRNGIIIDGGVHVGLFSLKASPYANLVIEIEPVIENYRLLVENLRRNDVHNVVPINCAL